MRFDESSADGFREHGGCGDNRCRGCGDYGGGAVAGVGGHGWKGSRCDRACCALTIVSVLYLLAAGRATVALALAVQLGCDVPRAPAATGRARRARYLR